MMGYVVGVVGALLVFAGMFVLTSLLMWPFLPPFLQQWVGIGSVGSNNIVGLVLSTLAAGASFRASVRRYRSKQR